MDKVINMTYPQLGERLIYHGPALQTLKTCHYNNDTEMIGDIVPDDNSLLILPTRTGQLSLYPAALDACLYACGMLYNVKGDRLIVVPDQFRLMEFGAGKLIAGKQCQCHVKRTKIIELPGGLTQVLFDFTLYNQDKQMVINVKDYCSTVVRNPQ